MLQSFFVFCGSSELSLGALETLKNKGILPNIIITRPDRPAGRKMILTQTCVSQWARENNITCIKPEKISEALLLLNEHREKNFIDDESETRDKETYIKKQDTLLNEEKEASGEQNLLRTICLVVSYGKILPQKFLDFFESGVWNIHPSDLPLYRGPSPIVSQVVDGVENIPVCLMKMDAGMDSGDILEKNIFTIDYKNIRSEGSTRFMENLELELGKIGGGMFAENYEKILSKAENYKLHKQDHTKATFTKFTKKEDGDVTNLLKDISHLKTIYQKWLAYNSWPGVFFFHSYKKDTEVKIMRVKISAMIYTKENNSYEIVRVIPEGKKDISLLEFQNAFGSVI